jgi:membrane protein implicated in regulation of membrane protease activity
MKVGELGPFHGPPRALGSMLGAPVAGLIIYIATAVTWLCLALYGFRWSISLWWGFLVFIVLLVLSWIFLRRWLRLTSTKPSSSDPQ